jgi:hypothetical protein
MNMKMRRFTTAGMALLLVIGLQAKSHANFVLGFDLDPSTTEQDTELRIAPGIPFNVDVLFTAQDAGGGIFPTAFSLDVTYDSTFLNVLDASFTTSPPRPPSSPQLTMAGLDLTMPMAGEFGIRSTTVGPFDAGGTTPLQNGTFVLGTLQLEGINNTNQDSMVTLLGFDGFAGLLADPGFTVSTPNLGPSTLVVTAIPEPATAWACLLFGSVGLASRRRRSSAS